MEENNHVFISDIAMTMGVDMRLNSSLTGALSAGTQQYTAGHEGAVADISCMSIFSASFLPSNYRPQLGQVRFGFLVEFYPIVKLREREGQRVDLGRLLKGHLWMVDGGWWISFP